MTPGMIYHAHPKKLFDKDYFAASALVLEDLYEQYQYADEDPLLEVRFLGKVKFSRYLRITNLDDELWDKYHDMLLMHNFYRRLNAYTSNAVHVAEKIYEKLSMKQQLDREAGRKPRQSVQGDRGTVYPKLATLTWDIDINALHANKTVESREQALGIARELWDEKLLPFFERHAGINPRFVLFTGGGLQLRFKAENMHDITILREFERLLPAINGIVGPEGTADNIFDPARIVRAPFTFNWGYKTHDGAVIPLMGDGIKKYDEDSEIDFIELAKALDEYANEHGINLKRTAEAVDLGGVNAPRVDPKKLRLKRIDAKAVYELFAPVYISGHQNDLLIRLFSVLAAKKVDIFSALELLAYFVHDKKNTPEHVINRLDHLTYAYGRVYNTLFGVSIEDVYGPAIYDRLAEFYNALVADLGISYDASDFERGLKEDGKVGLWPTLAKVLDSILAGNFPDAKTRHRVINTIFSLLREEIQNAPEVGGDDDD